MGKITVIFLLTAVLQLRLRESEALQCYNCHGVQNVSSCTSTMTCGPNQACYHRKRSEPSGSVMDLGCLDEVFCIDHGISTGVVGRSLTAHRKSRASVCSECCSLDRCNGQLCTHSSPSACVDDESVDCAKMSSLFNICTGNYEHASQVCPRFCNLCNYVNGNWADWSGWSACTITCGNATLTRTRTCSNPPPSNHGKVCDGSSTDYKLCTMNSCPVDGRWGAWSSWGACSASCDAGIQQRNRFCDSPPPAKFGDHCFGDSVDDRICMLQACADGRWTLWSQWSICSVTCGGGFYQRSRECSNPTPSPFGQQCIGQSLDVGVCHTYLCPRIDGGWSYWTVWSTCSVTCGGGSRQRYRECTNPQATNNGAPCHGPSVDIGACNDNTCDLQARLVSGRLEIFLNGQWGTVCDDSFDVNAARVACRMLGYSTYNAQVINPPDGLSSMPILLDDLVCQGYERTLLECRHTPVAQHNCGHGEDVGVVC